MARRSKDEPKVRHQTFNVQATVRVSQRYRNDDNEITDPIDIEDVRDVIRYALSQEFPSLELDLVVAEL